MTEKDEKAKEPEKVEKTEAKKTEPAAAAPSVPEVKSVFSMRPEVGRWVYVVIGLVMNICLGTVYAWSVFAKPMGTFFGLAGVKLNATQLNMPFLVFLAFFAVLMPIAGKFFNKFNPKIILAVGSVVVGLGWLMAGWAIDNVIMLKENAFTVLVAAYGAMAGGGVGIVYGGPIATSTRWFPDRKGFAVGLTVLGFGVSAAITAPLATYLIGAYSVPSTFMILGSFFLVILVLLSLLMSFPPAGWKPAGWTPPVTVAKTKDLTTGEMLRTPNFYAIWFCFLVGSITGLMAIGISKTVGMDKTYVNLSSDAATLAVMAFAIPNGLGRPLFGALTDKYTPRNAALLSFLLVIVGSLGMLAATPGDLGVALFIISFCCFWMCLGGWLAIAPTSTTTFFGAKNQPNNYGIVFSAYGIGAIIGNLMSGSAKDIFGSYRVVFYPTLLLACVGLIVAYLGMKPPKVAGAVVEPPKPKEDEKKPEMKDEEEEDDDEPVADKGEEKKDAKPSKDEDKDEEEGDKDEPESEKDEEDK